jgi:3-hydroxyisobutyrate dehydrogenase
MDVGFIGLGNMGARLVTLMIDGGHHLTLWARRPESLDPFAGRSDAAGSPAEVAAASELVGVCVWDEHDVDEVLLGEQGVLAGLQPGGVVAIHSTISPGGCRRLEAEAASRGVGFLDAPVSFASRAPKVLVMVGGEADTLGRCQAAFDSFGDPVVHLGPVGSGQIAKLVNNTMLAASIGLGDDAVALGGDLGLDETALAAVLAAGSAGGTWSSILVRRRGETDPEPIGGRTHEWASKDVGLARQLAAEAGVDPAREILRLGQRGVDVLN